LDDAPVVWGPWDGMGLVDPVGCRRRTGGVAVARRRLRPQKVWLRVLSQPIDAGVQRSAVTGWNRGGEEGRNGSGRLGS